MAKFDISDRRNNPHDPELDSLDDPIPTVAGLQAEVERLRLELASRDAAVKRLGAMVIGKAARRSSLTEHGIMVAAAECDDLRSKLALSEAAIDGAMEQVSDLQPELCRLEREVERLTSGRVRAEPLVEQAEIGRQSTESRERALEAARGLQRETLYGKPPLATTMLLASELLAISVEVAYTKSRMRVAIERLTEQRDAAIRSLDSVAPRPWEATVDEDCGAYIDIEISEDDCEWVITDANDNEVDRTCGDNEPSNGAWARDWVNTVNSLPYPDTERNHD